MESDPERFLGLGIVAVEELMITSSQRHVIPLQGRPFEERDIVNTLLTVQVRYLQKPIIHM